MSLIGHLFQGRYKVLLIDADNYLLALIRYIHLNPVRAGMVQNPEEYIWSSHPSYVGVAPNPSWYAGKSAAGRGGPGRCRTLGEECRFSVSERTGRIPEQGSF